MRDPNMNDMTLPPLMAEAESVDYDPFGAAEVQRVVPTTEAQREIWLADRLSPDASLAYNESISLAMEGTLDTGALARALQALADRHEALRANIGPEGTELYVAAAVTLAPQIVDLSMLDEAARAAGLQAQIDDAATRHFDLGSDTLVRATLVKLAPQQHELILAAHHIVCDGWSFGVLADELMKLYRAAAAGDPMPEAKLPPAPGFADYAFALAQPEALRDQSRDEDYWVARYDRSVPTVDLPTDRPRAPVRTFASRREDFEYGAERLERLRRFGSSQGATLFATLLGVFAGLVGRLGGHDDVAVGIPVAGQLAEGQEGLVGHCVNLLPVRLAPNMDEDVGALARNASTALLDGFDHSRMTFGSLLRRLQIARDPSRVPLVPVMFNVEAGISSGALADTALKVRVRANPRHFENAEIFLNIVQADGRLVLECQYNSDLFDADTIRRWMALYCAALDRCAADASIIAAAAFAPSAEEEALIERFNSLRVDYDRDVRVDGQFDAQVAAHPQAPALRCGSTHWSYRDLQAHADGIAQQLRAAGAQPGTLVGLCCDRSEHMIAALFGILKSGAGYVPLDPSLPIERLQFMAEDSGLRHIVGDATTLDRWQDSGCTLVDAAQAPPMSEALPPVGSATDVAYVIYTSGSTGKPKGVRVSHRTLASLLAGMREVPGVKPHHTMLAMTTLAFDLSVYEVMMPLTIGAQIVVADKATTLDGERLRALIEDENIDSVGAAPSTWRLLLTAGWKGRPDLLAFCGGEPLPPELARDLLGATGQLWNAYGPTEATMASTFYRVQEPIPALVPIGQPIANAQIYIMDERQRPLPIGVRGEICIAGDGVALGYLNRPELDAEKFIDAPTADNPQRRMYRSGDLGRWLPNGAIECQGRTDHQVKIRGYRIELGEIEANLATHPGVGRALVVTREDRPGDVRIVAYVVPEGPMPDADDLRAHLAHTLPAYMLPQHFVPMDKLPLFASGKVDRKALPPPESGQAARAGERIAPRNDEEAAALAAMEEVLSLPALSVDDDFFALGGHSLLAARLTARLNRDLGIQLPFRTIFEAPTAERLARAIAAARGADAPRREPVRHQPDRRSAPLTLMQERIVFMEELHPGRSVYNAPSGHRLKGPLDVPKFLSAMREVVRRQSMLRTSIGTDRDGRTVQKIAESVEFDVPLHDLSGLPEDDRQARLKAQMQALADAPFDIHTPPLFHAALFRLREDEHIFVFVPHHLIWDGWSFDVLQVELATIYSAMVRGESPDLPLPPVNYGDYAEWLERWLTQDECANQLRFWKERFASAPLPVVPGTDLPRRQGASGEGRSLFVSLDKDKAERLREIARSMDATLNMLVMSIYTLMVGRAIDADSVVIAVPVRGREVPELESVMGFFTNLLPVQLQVDRALPFSQFVRYIKQELLSVSSHQQIPFERVAAEPEAMARVNGAGTYHALFSFQDARERPRDFGGGITHTQVHIRQQGATEDLGLWLMDKVHGMEGAINYNADIYLPETGEAFRARFLELLERVLATPDASVEAIGEPGDSQAAALLSRLKAEPAPVSNSQLREPNAGRSGGGAQQLLMPEQAQLAQVWASVLHMDVNDIYPTDNFFDLGGDSLLAMRAMQQAEQVLGLKVEARRYVFESLAQLAAGATTMPMTAQIPAAATVQEAPRSLFRRVRSAFGRK